MPVYEHACRDCGEEWLEDYSLDTYDWLKEHDINLECPSCGSDDTHRCISSVPTHFKGAGWSPTGYYKYQPYDDLQADGKKVTLFEDKADLDRVQQGEKKQRILKRMKREDELAKRHLGPDAAFTEKRADAALKKRMAR